MDVNGAMITMDVQENATTDTTSMILTTAINLFLTVMNKKETYALNVMSLSTGKGITGNSVRSAIRIVKYVIKILFNVILVEKDFMSIIRTKNAQTFGLQT